MKPHYHDTLLLTLSDLKALFYRHLPTLKKTSLLCALLVFLFLLQKESRYYAVATFKQGDKQNELPSIVKDAFQQLTLGSAEQGVISVMRSNEVLKHVVEELGMQVSPVHSSAFFNLFKRAGENIAVELTGSLSSPKAFAFHHVSYAGEASLHLFLKLTSSDTYQVISEEEKVLAEGRLGERVSLPQGRLILHSVPEWAEQEVLYPFILEPWLPVVARLRERFDVRPLKTDKAILQLTFAHRDRFLAAAVLNQVMKSYQLFLKRENEEICQSQLAYLERRQQELLSQYDAALSEHAAYVRKGLETDGFIGFAQEIETFSDPKNLYVSKIFDLDLELKRRMAAKENFLAAAETSFKMRSEGQIHWDSCDLEQKRNTLIFSPKKPYDTTAFTGLTLDSAQKMLAEYTSLRDTLQAEVKELSFLQQRLKKSDFELSSLGTVFNDAVTSDLLHKASDIALQLKDNDNRSAREQERLNEALETQKSFLSQHLLQTIELKKLRKRLLDEKIGALHHCTISLLESEKELVGQKLAELNMRMSDLPEKWRRETLLTLKKEMNASMIAGISQLAETKYISQHLFYASSKPLDLALAPPVPKPPRLFLGGFLSAVASGVFCYLFLLFRGILKGLPVTEENLKLSGFPIAGALSFRGRISLSEVQGQDLDTLRALAEFLSSQPKRGEAVTALCLGGRHPDYSLSLAELLSMRGLKVLAIQCVFDHVVHREEAPGLWHYLFGEEENLPLRRTRHYDYLTSGRTTRHGPEIASHPKFLALLASVKPDYDVILIYTSADPDKIEGRSLLKIADAAIISVQREKKEDLEVYCKWAEKKGSDCALFVYAAS